MKSLRVSVLMPVYNGGTYLREAVESILNQTFREFEFIIIDDGSTDKSRQILENYAVKDSRIRLLFNERNSGICITLNKGLDQASGDYIVRMDADDISKSERIAKQVAYMDSHPNIGVAGSFLKIFENSNQSGRIYDFDTIPTRCKANMMFGTPLAHPSAIIRKSVLDEHNLRYDDYFRGMEDFHLWWRISMVAEVGNLPEVLLRYRFHQNQVTKNQINQDWRRREREFLSQRFKDLGSDLTESEINILSKYQTDLENFTDEDISLFTHVLHKVLQSVKNNNAAYLGAFRIVAAKAICYAIDKSMDHLKKSKFSHTNHAFLQGCIPLSWYAKRNYHYIFSSK